MLLDRRENLMRLCYVIFLLATVSPVLDGYAQDTKLTPTSDPGDTYANPVDTLNQLFSTSFDVNKLEGLSLYFLYNNQLLTQKASKNEELQPMDLGSEKPYSFLVNDSILFLDKPEGGSLYRLENGEEISLDGVGSDLPNYALSGDYYFSNGTIYQTSPQSYLRTIKNDEGYYLDVIPGKYDNLVYFLSNEKVIYYDLNERKEISSFDVQYSYPEISISDDKTKFFMADDSGDPLVTGNIFDIISEKSSVFEFSVPENSFVKEIDFRKGYNDELLISHNNQVGFFDIKTSVYKPFYAPVEPYQIEDVEQSGELIFVFLNKSSSYISDQEESSRRANLPQHLVIILNLTDMSTYEIEVSITDEAYSSINFEVGPSLNRSQQSKAVLSMDEKLSSRLQVDRDIEEISFSNEGNYLISLSDDEITVWDWRSLRQITTFPCNDCSNPQLNEENNELAFIQENSNLVRIDFVTGTKQRQLENIIGYSLKSRLIIGEDWETDEIKAIQYSDLKDDQLKFKLKERLSNINITFDGSMLTGVDGNQVYVYNTENGEQTLKITGDKSADYILKTELSRDGNLLLITYAMDGKILKGASYPWSLHDISSKERLIEGKVPVGGATPVLSKDSKYLYFISYSDSVYYLPNNPDQPFAYNGLWQMDISTGEKVELMTIDALEGTGKLAVHQISGQVAYSVGPKIFVYNQEKNRFEKESPAGIPKQYTEIKSVNSNGEFLLRNDRTVHFLDLNNPRNYKKFIVPSDGFLELLNGAMIIYEDTTSYWEDQDHYKVTYIIKDCLDEKPARQIVLHDKIITSISSLNPYNNEMLITAYSGEKYEMIRVDDDNNRETLFSTRDYIGSDKTRISRDGRNLIVKKQIKSKHSVELYDLSDNQLIEEFQDALNVLVLLDGNSLIIEKAKNNYSRQYFLYSLLDKKIVREIGAIPFAGDYNIQLSPNGDYLFAVSSEYLCRYPINVKEEIEKITPHDYGYPLQLHVTNDRVNVITYNTTYALDYDMREQYRIISSTASGINLQLPSGEYFVLSGEKPTYLNFIFEGNAYPFDQYDLFYNRPGKVLKAVGFASKQLTRIYKEAYLKRVINAGFDPDSIQLRANTISLSINNLDEIPIETQSRTIEIVLEVFDSEFDLKRLNIWVNNNPLYGASGLELSDSIGSHLRKKLKLELSEGQNSVQVSCINVNGVESPREVFQVNYKPAIKELPNLHIVAVSVSDYENDTYNLNFAAKDGRDLVKLLSKENQNYNHIYVDSLLDENATREQILSIKSTLLKTNVDDKVILFVSGHGLLDDNYNWWFATHDIDFKNPSQRGISYQQLESLLDSIPARNKLFMMDACHSGQVDKSGTNVSENSDVAVQTFPGSKGGAVVQAGLSFDDSFGLMQDLFVNLSRGSGSHVISAAAGNSYALESDKWQNGVFTYSVLRGLEKGVKDFANADQNLDGQVTVSELNTYVSTSVLKETGGRQKPASRQTNIENDFVIWH
jgi:hypothetical protein